MGWGDQVQKEGKVLLPVLTLGCVQAWEQSTGGGAPRCGQMVSHVLGGVDLGLLACNTRYTEHDL